MQHIKFTVLFIFSVFTMQVQAQERESDTLKTDVINVIKPYTPSISDAFKVKEQPNLNDTEPAMKKPIQYNIFSFPVASTFTPAKGTAQVIDKPKKEKLYSNYASLALGSNVTLLADVYLNHSLGRNQSVGAYLSHASTQTGVSNAIADTDLSNSKIDLNYANREKDLAYTINAGYGIKTNNWYGLQQQLFTEQTADSLDLKQRYSNAYVSGDLTLEDGIVNSAGLLFRRFSDAYSSAENRFKIEANSKIDILEEVVNVGLEIDHVSGTFDQNYFSTDGIKYANTQIGLLPTYVFTQDDLVVNLGFKTVFANDAELGKSKFFIYPNVTASYNLVDGYVSLFGGLTGGLNQNSYYAFAEENQFVSIDLFITPTDEQYKAFAGMRGKITATVSYEVNGSYGASKAQALFVNNEITNTQQPYTFGNSFGVVYDNMTTISLGGRLDVKMNQDLTVGVKGNYFGYNTKTQEEAWNMPNLKASVFADYKFTEKIYAGVSLFYVGTRKDLVFKEGLVSPTEPATVTLGSYLDANINAGYRYNDRLTFFMKGQNLTSTNYRKWQNTPVQGIEILAGANYKFDF